jgi:hypothetical protein
MRQRKLIIRYGALVSSVLTLCGLVFVSHHFGWIADQLGTFLLASAG